MESTQTRTHEKEETQILVDQQLQRLYHIIHQSIFMCFPKNFTNDEVCRISSKTMDKLVGEVNKLLINKTTNNETTSRNIDPNCQHDN